MWIYRDFSFWLKYTHSMYTQMYVWWSNRPPRTSLHINSLFICLYSNEGQNEHERKQHNRIRLQGFCLVFLSLSVLRCCCCWFVPFHHRRDFYFNTKPSQSYESNETVIGHNFLLSVPSKKNYMKYIRKELFWSLCVMVLVLILISWYICVHTIPLECSIMALNSKPWSFESDRKTWNQTGTALMNANKTAELCFSFYDQSLLTQ